MKSIYHGKAGANAKLRGKLQKLLSCGCCVLFNPKHSERVKHALREIRDFKTAVQKLHFKLEDPHD